MDKTFRIYNAKSQMFNEQLEDLKYTIGLHIFKYLFHTIGDSYKVCKKIQKHYGYEVVTIDLTAPIELQGFVDVHNYSVVLKIQFNGKNYLIFQPALNSRKIGHKSFEKFKQIEIKACEDLI